MHEYIPVMVLVVGLFAGIWLNRRDFSELKADMNRQHGELRADMNRQNGELRADMNRKFDEVNRRLDRIDGDLKEFYGADKQMEGRMNELSARVK